MGCRAARDSHLDLVARRRSRRCPGDVRIADAYESGEHLPEERLLTAYYRSLAKSLGAAVPPVPNLSAAEQETIGSAVAAFKPNLPLTPELPARENLAFTDFLDAASAGDVEELRRIGTAMSMYATQKNTDDWTPLLYAALSGSPDALGYLVGEGANVADVTPEGYSALHIAALSGSQPAVEFLLNQGLYALAGTNNGVPASYFAEKGGHSALATFLKDRERQEVIQVQTDLNRLGYSVGTADGSMGPRTRSQLTIFAKGQGLDGPVVTSALLNKLKSIGKVTVWAAAYTLVRAGSAYRAWDTFIRADSIDAAGKETMSECKATAGQSNCQLTFVLPLGSCVALVDQRWSKVFATLEEAEAEGLSQCRGAECKVATSFCVQP